YRDAMRGIYRRALEEVQAKMPPRAKRQRELVAELLRWAEKVGAAPIDGGLRGPAVKVRMRQLPSNGMKNAEKLVRINPYYNGDRSLPSRYLDRAHLEPLEQKMAASLAAAFGKAFRPELMTFAAGPAVERDDEVFEVPTFLIRYNVEPSGQAHPSRKPRGIFLGVIVYAEVELWLPNEKEPFAKKLVSPQRVPLQLLEGDGPIEDAVYRTMIENAFAEVEEATLADWFSRP